MNDRDWPLHGRLATPSDRDSFDEDAPLGRPAAESTCYFASVNDASPGSPTTSAVVRPDGTLLGYQPYNEEGLFLADLGLEASTCELARRYRDVGA